MKYLDRYDMFNEAWFPGKRKLTKKLEDIKKESDKLDKELEEKKRKQEEAERLDKEADEQVEKGLKQHFKDFFGKKYKFQYEQTIWTTKHSNYPEIDVVDFTFNGMKPEYRFDWDTEKITGLYLTLSFTDRYDKVVEVYFDEKSPTEKLLDLEYCKPWDKKFTVILHGNYKEKTDIDYDDESSYPHRTDYMDLVPAEYSTYNLLKEVQFFLKETNKLINHKKTGNENR